MMEIVVRPRLGIGLDIEHNEEICYRSIALLCWHLVEGSIPDDLYW